MLHAFRNCLGKAPTELNIQDESNNAEVFSPAATATTLLISNAGKESYNTAPVARSKNSKNLMALYQVKSLGRFTAILAVGIILEGACVMISNAIATSASSSEFAVIAGLGTAAIAAGIAIAAALSVQASKEERQNDNTPVAITALAKIEGVLGGLIIAVAGMLPTLISGQDSRVNTAFLLLCCFAAFPAGIAVTLGATVLQNPPASQPQPPQQQASYQPV